jgi:hypothetical protein
VFVSTCLLLIRGNPRRAQAENPLNPLCRFPRPPHWRFAAEFCTPGEGHEKGGVEGEGGYFRRNHLVPVPCVADLDALNALLLVVVQID